MTTKMLTQLTMRGAKWTVWTMALGLGTLAWAQEKGGPSNTAGDAKPAPAPAADGANQVLTGDLRTEAVQYSPMLQEFQRKYRLGRMIRDEARLQKRMTEIAAEIGGVMEQQSAKELPVWLKLQQDAYAVAGDLPSALKAMDRRFEILGAGLTNEEIVQRALSEAILSSAKQEYGMAEALYDKAESLAESPAEKFKMVMEKGRMVSERDGMDTAVKYYMDAVDRYMPTTPELAREAHFRAAEEFYRHNELDLAIATLRDMEERYAGTEEAEKARHAIRGWLQSPEERRKVEMQQPIEPAQSPPVRQ